MSDTIPTTSTVEIEVGQDARMVRIVRLAARSLATDASFDLGGLDDIALALDEVVTASMAVLSEGSRIRTAMDLDDLGLSVRGTFTGGHGEIEVDDITQSILDNATDRWTVGGDGNRAFHLVFLRPEVG